MSTGCVTLCVGLHKGFMGPWHHELITLLTHKTLVTLESDHIIPQQLRCLCRFPTPNPSSCLRLCLVQAFSKNFLCLACRLFVKEIGNERGEKGMKKSECFSSSLQHGTVFLE